MFAPVLQAASRTGLLVLAFSVMGLGAAGAQGASMRTGLAAAAPPAAAAFCRQSPADCARQGPVVRAVTMTEARRAELRAVNAEVNAAIVEVADSDHHGRADVWSLGRDGRGDCEDFALAKQRKLIERGWPTSVLLVTVVATPSGEGHAVLTVVTDEGDYVLDNRSGAVRLWTASGYEFFTRQAQTSPARWVWIETAAVAGL